MSYNVGDGRIWFQRKKFVPYTLLLPYGMTGVTDPLGAMTAVREPSPSERRRSVISDVIRAEPGLPEFQIETRLSKTFNYLLGLKGCAAQFQAHMGRCDRPDNYYASEIMLHWDRAHRGDLTIDRVAKIEGDDAPSGVAVPFSAEVGPLLIDLAAEFLSARTITETEQLNAQAFLNSECLENCQSQEDAGDNGYAVANAGSGVSANVHYTTDKGDNWTALSSDPFGNDEHISDVAVVGKFANHRVIVARGSADASNPAEIAYADVTAIGTVTWTTVDVGSITGQIINKILFLDYTHVYVACSGGYIYQSKDGGATWAVVRSGPDAALYDIRGVGFGRNAGLLVAVGDARDILLSEDYGVTWTAKTGPTPFYGDNIRALGVTPDGTIIVGDEAGELSGSFDFCANWTALSLQGITPTAITDIDVWGDSIIWVSATISGSARVLRSVDGGATFRLWNLNIPSNTGVEGIKVVSSNILNICGAAGFQTRTTTNVIGF